MPPKTHRRRATIVRPGRRSARTVPAGRHTRRHKPLSPQVGPRGANAGISTRCAGRSSTSLQHHLRAAPRRPGQRTERGQDSLPTRLGAAAVRTVRLPHKGTLRRVVGRGREDGAAASTHNLQADLGPVRLAYRACTSPKANMWWGLGRGIVSRVSLSRSLQRRLAHQWTLAAMVGLPHFARADDAGSPAASLLRERRVLVSAQKATRRAWWHDRGLLTLGLLPVAVPVLAWWGWYSSDQWAWVTLSFYAVMVGCRAKELHRLRCHRPNQQITAAIRLERLLANRLRSLEEQGFVLLFDRALPVAGTRVSHLVIGRAGLVVVGVAVPQTSRSERLAGRCRTSGLPAADDIGRLARMFAAELGHLPVPVCGESSATTSATRWDSTRGSCPFDRLVAHLQSLPRSLPEEAITLVAAVIDDLCPPLVRPTSRQPAPPLRR